MDTFGFHSNFPHPGIEQKKTPHGRTVYLPTSRWAPGSSYNWGEITPIIRVLTSGKPIYFQPFIGAP